MRKDLPETKLCKHCQTEIPYKAKVCPNCHRKVAGGKLKWIILAILVLAGFGALAGGGDGDKKEAQAPAQQQEEVQEQAATPTEAPATEAPATEAPATEAPATEAKIEYTKYQVTELFDDLKNNALKAQKKYEDQYVELVGYLGTIDSSGDYIGLGAADDNYDYLFQSVQCYIKSEDQLDAVMDLTSGDKIVVKGRIKSVGEVLGYSLDIDSIRKAKTK